MQNIEARNQKIHKDLKSIKRRMRKKKRKVPGGGAESGSHNELRRSETCKLRHRKGRQLRRLRGERMEFERHFPTGYVINVLYSGKFVRKTVPEGKRKKNIGGRC